MKNIPQEDVLRIVQQTGPTIPARITKAVGGDTFLIGAILNDLQKEGKIRVTKLKLGGSPFYYTPEQEFRLDDLSKYLKTIHKNSYELIKTKGIIRDREYPPQVRASLREIKDFAKPLEVQLTDEKEIFWKYYKLSNEDAKRIIQDRYMKEIREKKPEKKETQEKIVKVVPEETKKEQKEEKKKKPEKTQSEFMNTIIDFFGKKNIEVIEKEIIRKTEIDFIVNVPSGLGRIKYYCKAKKKKSCNDGDLSSVYIKGQTKKLPVLFLTTGKITKKAKEMAENELKGIIIRENI
ncbi:hypothetical protein JW949_00925 [Candidatus Woesearchaeota archaeon]|nr:hypothetical protein [Candidatus Woesearchaeota archaeon]